MVSFLNGIVVAFVLFAHASFCWKTACSENAPTNLCQTKSWNCVGDTATFVPDKYLVFFELMNEINVTFPSSGAGAVRHVVIDSPNMHVQIRSIRGSSLESLRISSPTSLLLGSLCALDASLRTVVIDNSQVTMLHQEQVCPEHEHDLQSERSLVIRNSKIVVDANSTAFRRGQDLAFDTRRFGRMHLESLEVRNTRRIHFYHFRDNVSVKDVSLTSAGDRLACGNDPTLLDDEGKMCVNEYRPSAADSRRYGRIMTFPEDVFPESAAAALRAGLAVWVMAFFGAISICV